LRDLRAYNELRDTGEDGVSQWRSTISYTGRDGETYWVELRSVQSDDGKDSVYALPIDLKR